MAARDAGCHLPALPDGLGCRMLQAYGLTEGSGFVCHEMPATIQTLIRMLNTVGKPTKRVELACRQRRAAHSRGEVGEILIRGERAFKEYWGDIDATKAAISDVGTAAATWR